MPMINDHRLLFQGFVGVRCGDVTKGATPLTNDNIDMTLGE